jgi:hypothetical protein
MNRRNKKYFGLDFKIKNDVVKAEKKIIVETASSGSKN